MSPFGVRYLDEDEMRRWRKSFGAYRRRRFGAYPKKEKPLQEMYQHLSGAPLQGEKENRMDYLDTLREQQGLAPEQLRVGDRVRLKGDHEGHWLTIKRMDELPRHPTDPNQPHGWFCTLSYWTRQPAGSQGAPVLSEMGGFRPECLTKEPPPTAKRPSWGRTVKTPAGAKLPVRRAKKR